MVAVSRAQEGSVAAAVALYIVAIAWLYVTVLMAATEHSVTAGVLTFLAYGLAPLALLLWLFGGPRRRRDAARAAAKADADALLSGAEQTDAQAPEVSGGGVPPPP